MTFEFDILRAADADQRGRWVEAWRRLPPGRQDVYMRPEYVFPFEAEGRGEAICAVAANGEATWLYPFLKCPIDSESDFNDIQTAYGYGGPVVNEPGENKTFLDAVWSRFSGWCGEANIVGEFCRFHPLLENHRWAPEAMIVRQDRLTVVFDLATYPETIWTLPYYRNHRNMVRRAEREGYTYDVISPVSKEDISEFTLLYNQSQDRLQSVDETRFSEDYFEALFREIAAQAWIGVVRDAESSIKAAVAILEGERFVHMHLMGFGTASAKHGVSNYLFHATALEAARRGFDFLHMGGGNSSDEADPLYRFKAHLSPERRQFRFGTRGHDDVAYDQIAARWEEKNGPRPHGYFQFYRT